MKSNNVEEKALKLYPEQNMYDRYLDGDNKCLRGAYIKGYNQALEDSQLTVDDIKNIYKICTEYFYSNLCSISIDTNVVFNPWDEILKRIKGK